MSDQGLSYQTAGVDIGEAHRALRAFKDAVRSTFTSAVLSDVGAFGGLYAASFPGYAEPVLVSSIDGVGTKTKIASSVGRYRGLGHDIVNHCANDILVQGARPIFFLDYFASSKLSAEVVAEVVEGCAEACRAVECALLGGETAEMPGVYSEGELDLVGCMVGVVERADLLPCNDMGNGDLIVGIGSDGLHTNGYSLARKALFERGGRQLTDKLPESDQTFADVLLTPHRCYLAPLLPALDSVKGLAHITGGGFVENVPRILGAEARAVIERNSWPVPQIFQIIQSDGMIPDEEMYKVFNMGIGMIAITASEDAQGLVDHLVEAGERAWIIGEITKGARGVNIV